MCLQNQPKSLLNGGSFIKGNFPQLDTWHGRFLASLGVKSRLRGFSQLGILTVLCCCHLGSKNLDQLVFLVKIWPNDPCQGCEAKSFEENFGVKGDIIDQLEEF